MPRPHKDPLRALSLEERQNLERCSRSGRESAAVVSRAKALLAVADGKSYSEAARSVGRKSGDAVAKLVECSSFWTISPVTRAPTCSAGSWSMALCPSIPPSAGAA